MTGGGRELPLRDGRGRREGRRAWLIVDSRGRRRCWWDGDPGEAALYMNAGDRIIHPDAPAAVDARRGARQAK